MSEIHAQTTLYVRDTMIDQQVPPRSQQGAWKWVNENLFSSALNVILTVLSILAVWYLMSHLAPWFFNSVWNAGSLSECREILLAFANGSEASGACWGVIRDRWAQLLFGFYPPEFYWRSILALILLFVALLPVLFPAQISSRFYIFSAIYPFLMVWILWGGSFWVPILTLVGFSAGYLAYRITTPLGGAITGTIATILGTMLWWLIAMPLINDKLHRSVAQERMETTREALAAQQEALPAVITSIEAQQAELQGQITAAVATKNEALASIVALVGEEGTDDTETLTALKRDFMTQMLTLTNLRERLTALGAEHFRRSEQKRAADGLVRNIDRLTENVANLPELRATALQARADLPEAVALLEAVPSGKARSNYEAADLTALKAVIAAEQGLIATDSAVRSTYNEVGRIGLQPVPSSAFGGFQLSLIIGITGIVMSLPLGILLALGRQSNLFIINKVSVGFIEVIRGVPLIVWLLTAQFLLNYFLPPGTTFDLVLRVIIMVTLFASAYIAEVVRGGLAALPHGQYEAADALGLDYWKSMRLIVLPQALKISIPGVVNTFIGLFKDTTLVLFIGLYDPLGLAGTIRASTDWNGIYWELFIFIGVLFFTFCFSMGRYSKYLENKLQRENR